MQIFAFKTSQVLLHMTVAFVVSYSFTGSLAVGGLAALVEPICNVILMPLHDKVWTRFRQRREEPSKAYGTDDGAVGTAA